MWLDMSIKVCAVWPNVSMKCELCCHMSRWIVISVAKCDDRVKVVLPNESMEREFC